MRQELFFKSGESLHLGKTPDWLPHSITFKYIFHIKNQPHLITFKTHSVTFKKKSEQGMRKKCAKVVHRKINKRLNIISL